MDKLLLIVEAEKNNRDIVKRGYRKLVADRDNVEVVVNKARSRIPPLPRWGFSARPVSLGVTQ